MMCEVEEHYGENETPKYRRHIAAFNAKHCPCVEKLRADLQAIRDRHSKEVKKDD